MTKTIPVACTLTGAELRARGREVADLFGHATQVRELRDGFALAFPGGDDMTRALLDFIIAERACCPFYSFSLRSPSPHRMNWLQVRGRAEAKELLRAALPSDASAEARAGRSDGGAEARGHLR